MANEDNKETVSIDEKEYILSELSEKARAQIENVQFVNEQIAQLNNELSVADTARIGYTQALKRELEKIESDSKS